jgi:AraC family transcriptional regulator
MNARIINLQEKKLIGIKSQMLQHEYQNIVTLWRQFMPRRRELSNLVSNEVIALQDYSDFGNFEKPFDIWACAEVSGYDIVPKGIHTKTIPEGLYAVFLHKGMNAGETYQRIMSEWLPNSGYTIDNRPHFQVMGDKYKNGNPDSEEDFYVPIKNKD